MRPHRGIVAMCAALVTLTLGPAADAAAQDQDPLQLSCAAFPPSLTESALVERFGASNVIRDSIPGMDDGLVEGTVIFADSEEARLEVVWITGRDGVERVNSVHAKGTRWRSPEGVGLGFELREVERMNGWPFRLAGLMTEAQGAVLSWGDGRLEGHDADGCSVVAHFQLAHDGSERFDLVRQIRSGREYSSGHPALQELNPRVGALRLWYPR